jgi:uncharacterized protein
MTNLVPQRGPVVAPVPSDLTRPFWEGCKQRRLLFQCCRTCNRPHFDPVRRCRTCATTELIWTESAGVGTVETWTVVWRSVVPTYTVPYVPAIVALDEGIHMVTSLVGCDHSEIHSGMRVAVAFHADEAGVVLPYFKPAPNSAEVLT